MGFFSRGASADDVATAVRSAVADATNSVTLAGHMAQCERDKAEMKAALLKQDQQRQQMHAETTGQFTRVNRVIWMAAGAITLLEFLSSGGGGEFLIKALHHSIAGE